MILILVSNLLCIQPKIYKFIQYSKIWIRPILVTIFCLLIGLYKYVNHHKLQHISNIQKLQKNTEYQQIMLDNLNDELNMHLRSLPQCNHEMEQLTNILQKIQKQLNIGINIKSKKKINHISSQFNTRVCQLELTIPNSEFTEALHQLQNINFIKIKNYKIQQKNKKQLLIMNLEIEILCYTCYY